MITPTQSHKFTSDKPYNRHKYELVFSDGRSVVIEDYTQMKDTWRQFSEVCSHVVVVDKKTKAKGF